MTPMAAADVGSNRLKVWLRQMATAVVVLATMQTSAFAQGGNWLEDLTSGFGTASNNYKMMGVSPANPNFVYVLESNGGRFGAHGPTPYDS